MRQEVVGEASSVSDRHRIHRGIQPDKLFYRGISQGDRADADRLSPEPQLVSSQWEAVMHGKFEELSDRFDDIRGRSAAVGQQLASIHDVEIYRPLPDHLTRFLNELDQVRGLRAGGNDRLTGPVATVE